MKENNDIQSTNQGAETNKKQTINDKIEKEAVFGIVPITRSISRGYTYACHIPAIKKYTLKDRDNIAI